MITFIIVLASLVGVTVLIQLLTNMKIVGGNELGVVSGSNHERGFRTFSGGRAFIIPLLQKFFKFDLTPVTIEVIVDSAIAAGIVPLNVKATVSFAIASNEAGRNFAVTRILALAQSKQNLTDVASDIIEGHLRDSIASMTPEQVMKDKDTLVAKMINVCKNDLENIGLEITTMNIADVDDHRLPGVEEPDLYIALLKRVQSVNAETKARQAQAEAKASSAEQSEARRGETEVKSLKNELERLKADVRVKLAQENQRKNIGVEQENSNSKARVSGIKAELDTEKRKIEMLENRYKAEITTPALAQKEKAVLVAKTNVANMISVSEAELEQLGVTLTSMKNSGSNSRNAWILDNFEKIFKPFTKTLSNYSCGSVSVITGSGGHREPLTAIAADAITLKRNDIIAGALESIHKVSNVESENSIKALDSVQKNQATEAQSPKKK